MRAFYSFIILADHSGWISSPVDELKRYYYYYYYYYSTWYYLAELSSLHKDRGHALSAFHRTCCAGCFTGAISFNPTASLQSRCCYYHRFTQERTKLREYLAQGPAALKWQSWKLNLGLSASKPFALKPYDMLSLRCFPRAGSRAGVASAPFSLSGSRGAGPRKGDGR